MFPGVVQNKRLVVTQSLACLLILRHVRLRFAGGIHAWCWLAHRTTGLSCLIFNV